MHHPLCGGWTWISDVTDSTVVAIGKFAVNEHNKQQQAHEALKFVKVVEGQYQVVAGMNYRLTITAADGSADKTYMAVVWDKPWENIRQLVSFTGPFRS